MYHVRHVPSYKLVKDKQRSGPVFVLELVALILIRIIRIFLIVRRLAESPLGVHMQHEICYKGVKVIHVNYFGLLVLISQRVYIKNLRIKDKRVSDVAFFDVCCESF